MRMKGNESMKAKEFDAAVKFYDEAIQIYPNDEACYSNRAMAYLKLKNYKNVIDDASKALELKPGYLKALHRRGKAYLA
jgi:tetratricopeptide (TPR) repeat protein